MLLSILVLGLPCIITGFAGGVLEGTFLVHHAGGATNEASQEHTVMRGDGTVLSRFKCAYDWPTGHSVGYLTWFNTKDVFVGTEQAGSLRDPDARFYVVAVNLEGEVTDTLYSGGPNEAIKYTYMSRDDSLAVFAVEPMRSSLGGNDFFSNFPFEPLSLRILEVKSRTLVTRIDGLFSNRHFELAENPWSPDQSRLTYTVQKLLIADEIIGGRNLTDSLWAMPVHGVFVYSLRDRKHVRIGESGRCAVWSPTEDKIAYIDGGSIVLCDLERDTSLTLYEADMFDSVRRIHWTPCGKYIFFTHMSDFLGLGLFRSHDQKCIRIEDGEEIEFERLPIRYSDLISWR